MSFVRYLAGGVLLCAAIATGCGKSEPKPGAEPTCAEVGQHVWDVLSKKIPEEMQKDNPRLEPMKAKIIADSVEGCEHDKISVADKKCIMAAETDQGIEACILTQKKSAK